MNIGASASIKPIPTTSNLLLPFYQGEQAHPAAYTIEDVWKFSYDDLEQNHDYIK
jgi:hypothetical protein